MRLNLARDHALCAELFKRKGERLKFQEHLGRAIELFKECGVDGRQKRAEEAVKGFILNIMPISRGGGNHGC